MARISLIEEEEQPGLGELIARIRSGRRGRLLNVYKLLLHAPTLAGTWFEHLNAVRWKTEIQGRLREMLIIRVATLNRIEYVLQQHVPALAEAEGLTRRECDALADWQRSSFFDERERAALAFADEMTSSVQVSDAAFADVERHFSERQIVELAVLIGTYNMHNRVFAALEIDPEPSR
jgi:alkylhydroperoxidase family enzyme